MYFGLKTRLLSLMLSISLLFQLYPATRQMSSVNNEAEQQTIMNSAPETSLAPQIINLSYSNANKNQIRIQFNSYLELTETSSIFIVDDNSDGSKVKLEVAEESIFAINPQIISGQSYASIYNFTFSEDIPQSGTIYISNWIYEDNENSPKSNIDNAENKVESISAKYEIPSRIEGYSVISPKQIAIFFNYNTIISEQNYDHFIFIGTDSTLFKAFSLRQLSENCILLEFDSNLPSSGRLVTDIFDSQGSLKEITSWSMEGPSISNAENLFVVNDVENPWLYISSSERINNNTIRIQLSEAASFSAIHPEEYVCSINENGDCVFAETVEPVDNNAENYASIFDIRFAGEIPEGAICFIDKKSQESQSSFKDVIHTSCDKSLFVDYELANEDTDYLLAYIMYSSTQSLDQLENETITDLKLERAEVVDIDNQLVRLIFSEPVHLNESFKVTGNCDNDQWMAQLDESISPLYENNLEIDNYVFSNSIVVRLGTLISNRTDSAKGHNLLLDTSNILLNLDEGAIVRVKGDSLFTSTVHANAALIEKQELYASLISAQIINSNQVELLFNEPVLFLAVEPEKYIYLAQQDSETENIIQAVSIEQAGSNPQEASEQYIVTFDSEITDYATLHIFEDRSTLKCDQDFFAVNGLIKAASGKSVASTNTSFGESNDEIVVTLLSSVKNASTRVAPQIRQAITPKPRSKPLSNISDIEDMAGTGCTETLFQITEIIDSFTLLYKTDDNKQILCVEEILDSDMTSDLATNSSETDESLVPSDATPEDATINEADLPLDEALPDEDQGSTEESASLDLNSYITSDIDSESSDEALNLNLLLGDDSEILFESLDVDTESPTAPSNLSIVTKTDTTITLLWEASTDNVGVEGYQIYRDEVYIASAATNSYQDTGLTQGEIYSYLVKAFDAAQNVSEDSNELIVQTITVINSNTTLTQNVSNEGVYLTGGTLDLNGYTLTINGSLTQTGGGLVLHEGELIITGDYNISGNGCLNMSHSADYVLVNGDFSTTSSAIELGELTAGILEIKGDFFEDNSYANNFNFTPSGSHRVIFSGTGLQNVAIGNSNSGFNYVEVASSACVTGFIRTNKLYGSSLSCDNLTISFTSGSNASIDNNFTISGAIVTYGTFNLNGNTLTLNGDISISGGTINPQNGALVSNAGLIVSGGTLYTNYGEVTANQGVLLTSGTVNIDFGTVNVIGAITQTGGGLVLNGGELIVSGDYDISGSGSLHMSHTTDYILINGNFSTTSSAIELEELTAGIMEIKGNFSESNSYANNYNFTPSGTHKVIFSGTTIQTINFGNSNSGFNYVEVASTSCVTGLIRANRLFGSTLNGSDLTVIFKSGSDSSFDTDVVYNGNSLVVSGTFNLYGHTLVCNLGKNTVIINATTDFNYGDVIVNGNLSLGSNINLNYGGLTVSGNLTIVSGDLNANHGLATISGNLIQQAGSLYTNYGSILVYGNALSSGTGLLNINGGQLEIRGYFQYDYRSEIVMQNPDGYMLVYGNFYYKNNSAPVTYITEGTLELKGSLIQIMSANWPYASFALGGNHVTVLSGDTLQTVTMASGVNHFNILIITKPLETGYIFSRIPMWNQIIADDNYTTQLVTQVKHDTLYNTNEGDAPLGIYTQMMIDLTSDGAGQIVEFVRFYNSGNSISGVFGRGWTLNYQSSCKDYSYTYKDANGNMQTVTLNNIKIAELPDGTKEVFILSNDTFTAALSRSNLVKNSDGTYTLITKEQQKYTYNSSGYLLYIEDNNTNKITINTDTSGLVQSVVDNSGQIYTVTYNSGLISSITDPFGRITQYLYTSGRLTSVTDPMGITNAYYAYDSSNFLNTIEDANQHITQAITYNHNGDSNNGNVQQIIDTYGNIITFTYDNGNRSVTKTDSNLRQTTTWYSEEWQIIKMRDADSRDRFYSYYNFLGDVEFIIDYDGNRYSYEYDSNSNITKIINPDLSYRTFTYDSNNKLLCMTDEEGNKVFYCYDTNGNIVKIAKPLNGVDIYTDEANQELFAITRYEYYTESERLLIGYNIKGLLKSVSDPEDAITCFTYDVYGNVVSKSDPETNLQTLYTYFSDGLVASATTPNGYTTYYEYDLNGLLVRLTSGDSVIRYVYDLTGKKTQEINPNQYNASDDELNLQNPAYGYLNMSVGTRYVYNSNGTLLSKTDPENYTISYTYDLYGNVLTETEPNGAVYINEYDCLDRITRILFKPDAVSAQYVLSEYTYSVINGGRSQKSITTYLDYTSTAITVYTYDYAGKTIECENPDGTLINTQYNPNGTVALVTRENGATTYYIYDGLNRLVEQWDSISPTQYSYSKTTYDKCDRVIEQKSGIDSVSLWSIPNTYVVKQTTYYSNGLVYSEEIIGGSKTYYYYDDDNIVNKIEQMINQTDIKTTEFANNKFGKPDYAYTYIRKGDIDGNTYSDDTVIQLQTEYIYDLNGNLISVTTPDNKTTQYTYDNINRWISTSESGIDEYGLSTLISTCRTLSWDNKELTITDANGHTIQRVYDARGFLIKQIDAEGNTTSFYYDRVGRLIAFVSAMNYNSANVLEQMNRTEYSYDQMGRVILVSQVYYDAQAVQWVSYVEKAYQYDLSGNLIKELDALGYEYGTGSTPSEKINSGYGTEYIYNLANQQTEMLDAVSAERSLSYTNQYNYDALGRLISQVNADGVIVNYHYDAMGNVLNVGIQATSQSQENTIQSSTYDLLNRRLTTTDGNGNTASSTYNLFDKVAMSVVPGDASIPSNTAYYQYDNVGNLIRSWDTTQKEIVNTYDPQGKLISQCEQKTDDTQAITVNYRYDENGNLRFVTDGNGVTTEYTYGSTNLKLTETVSGKTTTYTYDANGNLITATDWAGNTYTYVYDALNRRIAVVDPNSVTIETAEYNNNNVQTTSYDALGHSYTYTYDRNNRLISATDACNHIESQTYDNVGNIASKTDAESNTTYYEYDELNHLINVTNANNETTSYTYDENGNMLTFTDGEGNVTTYEYNVANLVSRLIKNGGRSGTEGNYTYVASKIESYTYDANGLQLTQIDQNGVTTEYTYDIHGRLIAVDAGSQTISYTYDNNNNLLTITDGTGTTTRTYDDFNRVITKTVPEFGQSIYAYDITTGLLTGYVAETTTDPQNNVVERIYDRSGRLVEVIADGNSTVYAYNANGSLQCITYDDGSSETYTYADDNLLSTLINKKADLTVIDSYTYTYDAAYNLISKVDSKGTTSYTYDALNRLATVTEPSGQVTSYTFDASGNRASQTVILNTDTTVTTYVYDDQNRLTGALIQLNNETTQSIEYTYDNNGNQLQTITTDYINGVPQTPVVSVANTYDVFNQLIQTITALGYTIINVYDGQGLRVSKSVNGDITNYLYEYRNVVLEQDDLGNQTAWNVYGINLIMREVGTDTLTYMYNGHGDVTALLDGSGALVATYYYDAFGNILEKTGTAENSILYGGYQYDEETGLYYLDARMYDPVTARFLQEDTYTGQANDPLSLNLYTYCSNEPLMYLDPSGHLQMSIAGALAYAWEVVEETFKKLFDMDKFDAGDVAGLYSATANKDIAQGIFKYAAAMAAEGVAISAFGNPIFGSAIICYSISLTLTAALDLVDDGVYNTSIATYVEAGVFGLATGGFSSAVRAATILTPVEKVVAMTLAGATSSAISQQTAYGSVDLQKVITSALFSGFLELGYQSFTGAFNQNIGSTLESTGFTSTAFDFDEAAGMGTAYEGGTGVVKTPYGDAVQSLSKEAKTVRTSIENGWTVYRGGTLGRSNAAEGQFWAPENPLNPGYADRYGVDFSKIDFIIGGKVKPNSNIITRPAPGLGTNGGGAIEMVTDPINVILDFFYMP